MSKRKRSSWNEDDEAMLLALWGEKVNDLRRNRRNAHIYAEIATELKSHSAEEVHTKITNFTQRYRSEKKFIGNSGGSPSTWKHYDEVHKILGPFKSNNLDCMDETFILENDDSASNISISIERLDHSELPSYSPIDMELFGESNSGGATGSSSLPSTSASSASTSRPTRNKFNTLTFQKEMLQISKENLEAQNNHNIIIKDISNEQTGIMRKAVELMEESVESSKEIVSIIKETSREQMEFDKAFMQCMKEVLSKNTQ